MRHLLWDYACWANSDDSAIVKPECALVYSFLRYAHRDDLFGPSNQRDPA